MKASKIRLSARNSLEGKWGEAALVTLCYTLIMYGISLVLAMIPIVGQIANIIITPPITYGIAVTFMKLKRGEEVQFVGFLSEGFNRFGKVWGVYWQTVKKMLLPAILAIAFGLIMVFSIVALIMYTFSYESFKLVVFLGVAVISFIGYIVSLIYCYIKGMLYVLANYILYDNPNMTSKEIVKESERLMRGNRGKYIWLGFTFFGWIILSVFTLYIGLLWLLPYMAVTCICFYEALSGKVLNKETIQYEENNEISE